MIAIVSDNKKDRQEWIDKLAPFGMGVKIFGTIEDLREHHSNEQFSGLIIQDWAFLGGSFKDKALISEIEEFLPVMRLSKKQDSLSGVVGPQRWEGETIWNSFVLHCRKFKPNRLRGDLRRTIYLNIHCSSGTELGNAPISFRANTADVSLNGCFVLHANELPLGTELTLKIQEIKDPTPIKAIVRWNLNWGKTQKRPAGFGVIFTQMNEAQKKEIRRYIEMGAD